MILLRNVLNKSQTSNYLFKNFVRQISETRSNELICETLQGPDKGIVVFGFNRPKQKNALSTSFADAINEALYNVSVNSEARVLLLKTLVPGAFCAGADLKERLAMPQEKVGKAVANLRSLMDKIYNLSIPVIAAMDGLALGGGLEMALACDVRIASSDAKMGLVEGRLGIIPGAGGTQRLPRLVGPSIAKELIFTARVVDASTAHSIGLVNHVVNQNTNGDAAFLKSLDLAREILPNGPIALQMAKKAINKGTEVDISTGLSIEEACYAQVIPTKDRIEGLQAFKEKRKPNYTGQ